MNKNTGAAPKLIIERAESSGQKLSEKDAGIVKGMALRGDRKHDIAAWFGVNQGRVSEVLNGTLHSKSQPVTTRLPPVGPYNSGIESEKMKAELVRTKKVLEQTLRSLNQAMSHFGI